VATGRQAVPADIDWKDAVTGLVRSSALIVLFVGENEGIRWEMETIARQPGAAAKAIFLNADPDRPAVFQQQIDGLSVDVPRDQKLLGVVFVDGAAVPILSSLAEDVDYEAAVMWAARRL